MSRNPIETMARWGYGARGVVYGLVGGFAALAAVGAGGQTGGSRSALAALLERPFGWVLLLLIAAGLAGFGLWRAVEALTDADRRGNGWGALAARGAHLVSAGVYAALAFFALSLALGWASGGGDEDRSARDWTAWLLQQPFGRWLVALAGAAVAGAGFGFLRRAWRGAVAERLRCDAAARRWVDPIGRFGFAARGVVFLLIGGFLVVAAVRSSSASAKGLGGALEALQDQPYGWILLGVTAAGLFAFGVFGLVQARYRRIDAPDLKDAAGLADASLGRLGR